MNTNIENVSEILLKKFETLDNKTDILKATELKALYSTIPTLPQSQRSEFGRQVNQLTLKLKKLIADSQEELDKPKAIDITAPFDINQNLKNTDFILTSDNGSSHPLMKELDQVLDIFYRMGFSAIESRIIDDDFHMFGALNFPEGHPARDDYDTFMTEEKLVAPAHTSTMQNRVLQQNKHKLEDNAGNLMATLRTFLEEYYGQELEIRSQPFYFPFTEPSFEFALSCPFCKKQGCSICSFSGFIELLGCGMIHPNVLEGAGIDANVYSGFAFGFGLDRLIMMKYDIEDVRNLKSSKLEFLRQFS